MDPAELASEGLLIGLGEVSAAFAGFASVVAIFGRRAGDWPAADRFRFQNLLVMALSAALYAFVPLILVRFGLATETVWRASSVSIALFFLVTPWFQASRVRRIGMRTVIGLRRWMAALFLGFAILAIGLQVFNLFPTRVGPGPGPYATALFLMLTLAALQFALLVLGPLEESEGSARTARPRPRPPAA